MKTKQDYTKLMTDTGTVMLPNDKFLVTYYFPSINEYMIVAYPDINELNNRDSSDKIVCISKIIQS